MIQDHPVLNLLKTFRGRVRWVGHGRKPLETGDGSATVSPEAAVSHSHSSSSAGYIDVCVKVYTDDNTGIWLCEDIPTVFTLEMLKDQLHREMSCLQPYSTG